ncbi:MAG: DinB family protein [Anaerolineales bacterium]|nr:DinB family protein [Anaerolineales bacterium]
MISIQNLTDFYSRNLEIINMQAEGLTHEDSLIQLPFLSNCLNWVIGHILANRCNILALLRAEDFRPDVNLDHYERESDPVLGEGEGVLPLEELIDHLEESQIRLAAALKNETEESLQRTAPYRDRPERPLSYWLFFLYFHDSYHIGQTEILRQAAGKDDKII